MSNPLPDSKGDSSEIIKAKIGPSFTPATKVSLGPNNEEGEFGDAGRRSGSNLLSGSWHEAECAPYQASPFLS